MKSFPNVPIVSPFQEAEFKPRPDWLKKAEALSVFINPHPGICPGSPFENKQHRVGIVRIDGIFIDDKPGETYEAICLECGHFFQHVNFNNPDQPNHFSG